MGPGTMGQRRDRTQRKKVFSISVVSNHCFSLSCSFNFSDVLNAWKNCWTQYKEYLLPCKMNFSFMHISAPISQCRFNASLCCPVCWQQLSPVLHRPSDLLFSRLNSFLKTYFFCLILQCWSPSVL